MVRWANDTGSFSATPAIASGATMVNAVAQALQTSRVFVGIGNKIRHALILGASRVAFRYAGQRSSISQAAICQHPSSLGEPEGRDLERSDFDGKGLILPAQRAGAAASVTCRPRAR